MPPRIWDAYKTFNLVIPSWGGDLFCAGIAHTKGGAQCRIRLPIESCATIRSILSQMESGPPNGAGQHRLLQQLARLSLCDNYHRQPDQFSTLLNKWRGAMDDVIRSYEKDERLREASEINATLQEKVDRLERSLRQISIDREEEHGRFERYRRDTEARESDGSRDLGDLESDLEEERRKSSRLKDDLDQMTSEYERNLDRLQEVQSQLATELRTSEKLKCDLNTIETVTMPIRIARLENELNNERQESEHLKTAEAELRSTQTGLRQEIETLRVQLAAECHKCEQLKESSDEVNLEIMTLSRQLESLRGQTEIEHQYAEKLQDEIEKAKVREASLNQKLTAEQQNVAQLRCNIEDRKTIEVSLKVSLASVQNPSQSASVNPTNDKKIVGADKLLLLGYRKLKSIQTQLEAENQKVERLNDGIKSSHARGAALTAELADAQRILEQTQLHLANARKTNEDKKTASAAREGSLSAQLASIRDILERTQLDLANNMQANAEERASAATRDAENLTENAHLQVQIRELERQISESIWVLILKRMKGTLRRVKVAGKRRHDTIIVP